MHIYAYLACITYVAYKCILCQYCYFVLRLQQEQKKCCRKGLEEDEAAAGRAGLLAWLDGDRPGQRSWVAKPERISMSLRVIMKSVHKPVVVGLAGMVQEQPATLLAGMNLAEMYINM